jgi:hypothetical protein
MKKSILTIILSLLMSFTYNDEVILADLMDEYEIIDLHTIAVYKNTRNGENTYLLTLGKPLKTLMDEISFQDVMAVKGFIIANNERITIIRIRRTK